MSDPLDIAATLDGRISKVTEGAIPTRPSAPHCPHEQRAFRRASGRGGPRPTLKKAFAEKIISSPQEADVWLAMLEDRNLTAHAYDAALAERIHGHILKDYAPLLGSMARRIQLPEWD